MAVVIQRVDLSDDYRVWLKAALNGGRGTLLSLSPGGAYIASEMAILPQAQLRVKIFFPDKKRSFEVGAIVNWDNRGENRKGPFPEGYGIRFTEVDSQAVEAIRDILKSAVVPKVVEQERKSGPEPEDLSRTVPLMRVSVEKKS